MQRLRRLSRRRSARREEGRFLIEGPHLLADALAVPTDPAETGSVGVRSGRGVGSLVESVFIELDETGRVPESVLPIADAAEALGLPVERARAGALRRVLDLAAPQPVVAVAVRRAAALEELVAAAVEHGRPLLLLAGLADPGNAGTLIRVGEAAGVAGVVALPDTVDLFAPKTVRAAAGSVLRVPIAEEVDPMGLLEACRDAGLPLLGTVARGGVPLWEAPLPPAAVVAVGSEAHGLPPVIARSVELGVTIPMEGAVESLNAGVAGALVLMESARRRSSGRPRDASGA